MVVLVRRRPAVEVKDNVLVPALEVSSRLKILVHALQATILTCLVVALTTSWIQTELLDEPISLCAYQSEVDAWRVAGVVRPGCRACHINTKEEHTGFARVQRSLRMVVQDFEKLVVPD